MNIKSVFALSLLGSAFFVVTGFFYFSTVSAQGVCGTIVSTSGIVAGYTDCENPFNADSGFSVCTLSG